MGLMAMAATFWATALLMAAVCCWASFPLSRLMTLKPYLAAFFWYIFQEKAWDGFCHRAMNASVGLSPPAAGDAAPLEAAGDAAPRGGRRGRCRPGTARGHDEDEGPQGRRSASEMFGNCHLFSSVSRCD